MRKGMKNQCHFYPPQLNFVKSVKIYVFVVEKPHADYADTQILAEMSSFFGKAPTDSTDNTKHA